MATTFVFGTGFRIDDKATAMVIEPITGQTNATIPLVKREATRIYILHVKCYASLFFTAPTREELEERIRIRKYPKRLCTIHERWTSEDLKPSVREISVLALELPDSFDKLLFDNNLATLGRIIDEGPKRLQRIGFDGDDIRTIRARVNDPMAKARGFAVRTFPRREGSEPNDHF